MWYLIVGFMSGIIGAMGLGGGTILIPMLISFFNTKQKFAQFVNLIAFIFMAVFAVIMHKKNGLIDFELGIVFAIFGVVFAFIASLIATKLSGGLLRKIFGFFLITIGFLQLFAISKKRKNKSK